MKASNIVSIAKPFRYYYVRRPRTQQKTPRTAP